MVDRRRTGDQGSSATSEVLEALRELASALGVHLVRLLVIELALPDRISRYQVLEDLDVGRTFLTLEVDSSIRR